MDFMKYLILRKKKKPKQYDGIPVLIDNARFPRTNGATTDVEQDNDWFIAGWFDSGDSTKKSYTYFRAGAGSAAWRVYNDKDSTSVDWWAASTDGSEATPTISTAGRYILFSVNKAAAARTYLMLNGEYVFKGKDVT